MKVQTYNVKKIRRKDIIALIKYIPLFTMKRKFGEPPAFDKGSFIFPILIDEAEEFYKDCYKHNLVQPFDWNSWLQGNERLVFDGEGIENCDLETLGKLMTTHIRGDRFNDGHLLGVMNSGALGRILLRLKEISGIGEDEYKKPEFKYAVCEVCKDKEHFIIHYGDSNTTEPAEWVPVVMIGRSVKRIYPLQWLIDIDCKSNKDIVKEVLEEINAYLLSDTEKNPWGYAEYHCTTAANIYSPVHWSFIPKNEKSK